MSRLLLIVAVFSSLYGKDFGVRGEVFPIEEKSLLDYILENVADREFDFTEYRQMITEYFNNPPPVSGIVNAVEFREFVVDMTHTAERDVQLRDGTLLIKAGTKINPLDEVQLEHGMLFFDGSNSEHIAWAERQPKEFWFMGRIGGGE